MERALRDAAFRGKTHIATGVVPANLASEEDVDRAVAMAHLFLTHWCPSRAGCCLRGWGALVLGAVAVAILLVPGPKPVLAGDFYEDLARVDQALKKNPARVPFAALRSCQARRNLATQRYELGDSDWAERSLRYCERVLGISDTGFAPTVHVKAPPSMEEVQARAAREVEQALALTPSIENGRRIYRSCAQCHKPEGWGLSNGLVPQLAGQHRKVVIKQLVDIRAGNRENPLMLPYSSVESIGSAQAVADVAGYIDTLEISVDTGKGPGDDRELGKRLYQENCVRCHGEMGRGDNEAYVPRIQAQHYNYLVRQFESIRDGKRRNASPEMVAQIQGFDDRETRAVLDYVSRVEPPAELQAPPGWHDPDFAD